MTGAAPRSGRPAAGPGPVGLVVNPVAGLGGRVGLEGSDGRDTQRRALALGAVPHAGDRATTALRELAARADVREVLTAAGPMGEHAVRAAGLRPRVVYGPGGIGSGRIGSGGGGAEGAGRERTGLAEAGPGESAPGTSGPEEAALREAALREAVLGEAGPAGFGAGATGAYDTIRAVRALAARGAGLILFAGGDGTARDVLTAMGGGPDPGTSVLGIPTGVKMHSAVFAVNARAAGEVASAWLHGRDTVGVRDAAVMDRDEERLRAGHLTSRLYGWLPVPHVPVRIQQRKAGSTATAPDAVGGIAAELAVRPAPGELLALGPGSTTRAVAAALGVEIPLTGVSLLRHEPAAGHRPAAPDPAHPPAPAPPSYRLLATHLSADRLLAHLSRRPAHIALSPIGGQGFLLGRGNQQISPEALRAAGTHRLHVLCTEAKLAALHGRPLLVDTGDDGLDAELSGYRKVITGHGRTALYRIAH
ncbi:ATP-NAD kinase family protein [Streptomyces sp. NPDC004111]|uniref:ATP-NAD kinase family protein n=1 Tax=Streptomyces sp. NPDC004111 TaxID=3364690 RepID=UPI0036BCD046